MSEPNMPEPNANISENENTEPKPQATAQPRALRVSVVVIAILVTIPAVIVVGYLLPQAGSEPMGSIVKEGIAIERSFNGDGPINVTEEGVAIKGYDVVAYFEEGRAVEGLPEIEAEHQGATFRFASKANHDLFVESPEAYIPAYGGYCALGVANGYKDDLHPEAFEIVDDRLYFNLTPRIGAYWSKSHDEFIKRADENWPKLRDAPGHGPVDAR